MSFVNMSVTFDAAASEYGGQIEDLQLPIKGATMPDQQPATVTGADIIARARSYKGKIVGDSAQIPALAREVSAVFPDMASYAAEASATTEWCGIFCAKVLAEFGIRPPFGPTATDKWMWVDAWKAFGTPVAVSQAQPGDIAMWFGGPHHVSFVAGDGKFCGGNQGGGSGAVTESSMRAPEAVRRPPVAFAVARPPVDTSNPSALPLLVMGDVGPYVEKLQKLLGAIEVDGEFGEDTAAAVRAFQASHLGLEVDGEVGPQTWAALLGKPVAKPSEPARYLEYRDEYAASWQRMSIDPDKLSAVDRIAQRCLANRARYEAASAKTGVPWFVIAAWHDRESSGDFSTQLAQGDPLNQVSHNVPAGRGPFPTWEAGAYDALVTLKALNTVTDWTIERICYESERYNGFGYRSHGVPSAYLWSFSNIYTGGKYVADGVWSSTARDAQCGVLPLIQRLAALDASIELRSYQDAPPPPIEPEEPDEPDVDEPELPEPEDLIARIEDLAADLRKKADTLNTLARALQQEKEQMPKATEQQDLGAALGPLITALAPTLLPVLPKVFPQIRPFMPLIEMVVNALSGRSAVVAAQTLPVPAPSTGFPQGTLTGVLGVVGTLLSGVLSAKGWIPPAAGDAGMGIGLTAATIGGGQAAKAKLIDKQ